jgi:hypothetical protein
MDTLKENHILILVGKGNSKKYFLKKTAEKLKIKFIELFG